MSARFNRALLRPAEEALCAQLVQERGEEAGLAAMLLHLHIDLDRCAEDRERFILELGADRFYAEIEHLKAVLLLEEAVG